MADKMSQSPIGKAAHKSIFDDDDQNEEISFSKHFLEEKEGDISNDNTGIGNYSDQETTVNDNNDSVQRMDVEEEVDPLDAYMLEINQEVRKLDESDLEKQKRNIEVEEEETKKRKISETETAVTGEGESEAKPAEGESGKFSTVEELIAFAQKKAKKKDIVAVDHETIKYKPFRKDFYVETAEISRMSDEEVKKYRLELDNIKIRGVKCPRPVKKWVQCGLSSKILEVIEEAKYEKPTPIQAQAIPAIMSGRDLIGIAKTGSGKTMAFLLPMFRHVMDQPTLGMNDGPIALIMTPTRELAMQTYSECMKFAKPLGLKVVCAYGGAPVKDQIADLKRGAEIVICTPGRMIDLLLANSGKVTNLKRITYLVLDEADRMFDLGFGPQVLKIVGNIRPDKQVVLFSATFPRQMDALARKILIKPVEIIVGGISTVCEDVTQCVEVVEEDDKFIRLLELLGEWYESRTSRILIFVDRQDAADNLLRDLLKRGYPCLSLHGGKDQADRDSTIQDFKVGNIPILVATSVAARGLDVKELGLVINYDCPNHMEDYVHRVGRTGRAGNKGTAFTFITPEQERFAPDIVRALKNSEVTVPERLQKIADDFMAKVRSGQAQTVSSGFSGKGLERIDEEREALRKAQKISFGAEELVEEEEEEEEQEEQQRTGETGEEPVMKKPAIEVTVKSVAPKPIVNLSTKKLPMDAIKAVQQAAAQITTKVALSGGLDPSKTDALSLINAKYRPATGTTGSATSSLGEIVPMYETKITTTTTPTGATVTTATLDESSPPKGFYCEIDINDYPQMARWKITNRESVSSIIEYSGTSIVVRGLYFAPGKQPVGPNERRLHMRIEGPTEVSVEKARGEINRILVEATLEAAERGTIDYSRYNL